MDQGCCQCIGDTCIDYGLNEPHCLACKGEEDEDSKESKKESIHDVIMEENEIDKDTTKHKERN